jgi:hypothetical protein
VTAAAAAAAAAAASFCWQTWRVTGAASHSLHKKTTSKAGLQFLPEAAPAPATGAAALAAAAQASRQCGVAPAVVLLSTAARHALTLPRRCTMPTAGE